MKWGKTNDEMMISLWMTMGMAIKIGVVKFGSTKTFMTTKTKVKSQENSINKRETLSNIWRPQVLLLRRRSSSFSKRHRFRTFQQLNLKQWWTPYSKIWIIKTTMISRTLTLLNHNSMQLPKRKTLRWCSTRRTKSTWSTILPRTRSSREARRETTRSSNSHLKRRESIPLLKIQKLRRLSLN